MVGQTKVRERAINRALALVTEAIDLIDAHDGPADAAANLALAQDRLRRAIRRFSR
jgi:hypothetical protein